MSVSDSLVVRGCVEVTLLDSFGSVKVCRYIPNLVVGTGLGFFITRAIGSAQPIMSHMAVGSGSVVASLADTTLNSQVGGRKVFDSTLQSGGYGQSVVYTTTFTPGEGTGTLTEAGIFNAAVGGVMLCRTVFAAVPKGVSDSLQITWTISLGV